MARLNSTYNVHPLEKEYTKRNLKLRGYQEVGVKRMVEQCEKGKGVINGDEMGLGKTCQAIVAMVTLYSKGAGPFLVSAPLTVLPHWMEEIKKFSCGVLEPFDGYPASHVRADNPNGIHVKRNMVFVTSNKVILKGKGLVHPVLEIEYVAKCYFKHIIVDEAQVLKGCSMFRDSLYKKRKNRCFILLTGTPLQNNVAEAFSLLQFIDNSYEDVSVKDFVAEYSGAKGLEKLKKILSKVMIRRLKTDVMELPESCEVVMYHGLSPLQKQMYLDYITGDSRGIKKINVFMQLRKIVSHPYLFKGIEPEPYEEGEHLVLESGKMRLFSDLCRYLSNRNHKLLVFCQYLTTCDIIEDFMEMRGYKCKSMCGNTKIAERAICINEFQNNPDVFAFIMTTKTGGVGLTLTAADTVVFFDSDVNPHNDLQAMARTHRIGQTKAVRVIRLIGSGTVDDYVYNVAYKKLRLHKSVTGESIEPRSMIDFDEFKKTYRSEGIQDAVAMTDDDIEKLLGKTNENFLWDDFVDNDENFVQDCNERPARLNDFLDFEGGRYRGVRNKRIEEDARLAMMNFKPVKRREEGFYAEPTLDEFLL